MQLFIIYKMRIIAFKGKKCRLGMPAPKMEARAKASAIVLGAGGANVFNNIAS